MKRLVLIAVLMAVTMILTACGDNLTAGVIIGKEYVSARTVTNYKVVGLTTIPQCITIPAKYRIHVRGTNEEGSEVTEWWVVDAATYGRLQVGMNVMR